MEYQNTIFGGKKIKIDNIDAHRLDKNPDTAFLSLKPGDEVNSYFWGIVGGSEVALVAETLNAAGISISRINPDGSREIVNS